jgi:hypothetical protein
MTIFRKQLTKLSPLSITMVLVFASIMTYFLINSFAATGTATLYTSPGGSQSATIGQTFTVSVRVSSGANVPVTGASVYLTYPTSKLQVVGENYSGSAYSTQLVSSNSGGIFRMDRAAFPMISGGDQLFAQVTFKAIAAGSAPINFTNSSIVTSGQDDSNILTSQSGVTYTVSAATTNPTSSPASGSGSSATPVRPSSASGKSNAQGSPAAGGTTTTGNSSQTGAPLDSDQIASPASEGGGTNAVSGGSLIQITVLDTNNKPIEGATVTIASQTARSDKNGVVSFTNISAGKQALIVSFNGKKTSKDINVTGTSTESPELFKVSVNRDKYSPVTLIIPVIILLAVGLFFIRPWSHKFAKVSADPLPVVTSERPPTTPAQSSKNGQLPGSVYTPESQNTPEDNQKPN